MSKSEGLNLDPDKLIKGTAIFMGITATAAVVYMGLKAFSSGDFKLPEPDLPKEIAAGQLAKQGCEDTLTEFKVTGYASKIGTESTYVPFMHYDALDEDVEVKFIEHATTTYRLHEAPDAKSPYVKLAERSHGFPLRSLPFAYAPKSDYSNKVEVTGRMSTEVIRGHDKECVLLPIRVMDIRSDAER